MGLILDSIGTIEDIGVYQSSGSDILDRAAISAAWKTRWTPAQRNRVGVRVWTIIAYRFEID